MEPNDKKHNIMYQYVLIMMIVSQKRKPAIHPSVLQWMLPVTQLLGSSRWKVSAGRAPGSHRVLMAAPGASAMRILLVQGGEQRSFGTPIQAMSAESKSLQLAMSGATFGTKMLPDQAVEVFEPPRGTRKHQAMAWEFLVDLSEPSIHSSLSLYLYQGCHLTLRHVVILWSPSWLIYPQLHGLLGNARFLTGRLVS